MEDGRNISSGMGQGAAQIFRPFDYGYVDRSEASRQREAAAKQAAGQKNLSDLSKQLKSLNKLDVFFRDQPLFAQKNKEIWDFAHKNIRKYQDGDINTKLAIDQMAADLENNVALSKNVRELYEQTDNGLNTGGRRQQLRPEAEKYLHDFANDPANIGNYNFDQSQIKFNIDLGELVNKDLIPIAKMKAEKGQTHTVPDEKGIVYTTQTNQFTPAESKELIKEWLQSDPIKMDQANYNYSKATPEEKNLYKDPFEYEASKYTDRLVINDIKQDVKGVGGRSIDFGLNIGDGMAYNDKYRFTGETKEVPYPGYVNAPSGVKKIFTGQKTVPAEVIKVKTIKGGENPKYNIVNPKRKGETFVGVLDAIQKYKNGKMDFVFVDSESGEYVYVPEGDVTSEVKNDIGYDPRKLYETGITKGAGKTVEKGASSAQKGKAKPKVIKQKGITYTLNEKTGQYE